VCKRHHKTTDCDLLAKIHRDVKSHCHTHNQEVHHFFINYRVATEKKVTETLYNLLACQKMKNGDPVHVFWDIKCLNVGHDWEEGFLRWLTKSKVIVLLISQEAIKKIASGAQSSQDNVLVEYPFYLYISCHKFSGDFLSDMRVRYSRITLKVFVLSLSLLDMV